MKVTVEAGWDERVTDYITTLHILHSCDFAQKASSSSPPSIRKRRSVFTEITSLLFLPPGPV
ncbi:hypothetical protein B7P43_G17344 [Cryptotermes secundus]|uniref:Uncharacterized protein n=1 Tax=Cryptotermes secundus TaxID=105785 RepID=A0A2J7PME4_9NEOP|nr:hypothetical protein B7P43_G17344 [Cryptotermes secundus]